MESYKEANEVLKLSLSVACSGFPRHVEKHL